MATITRENAEAVRTFYAHTADDRARAKPNTSRIISVRAMGAVKTWKTRPNDFRIPVKYGMYNSFYITQNNGGLWHDSEASAAAAPVERGNLT